jgi:prevent-host-death family protein
MKTFAFSDLNRQSGEVLDAALAAPVTLTKHGKPKLVVMSVDEFDRMARHRRAYTLTDAPDDIHGELMAAIDEILGDDDAAGSR